MCYTARIRTVQKLSTELIHMNLRIILIISKLLGNVANKIKNRWILRVDAESLGHKITSLFGAVSGD